jgi:hypothetical protein
MLKQTPYTAAGGRVLIGRLWKNHGADDDNGLHQRRAPAVPDGCLHHLYNYRDRWWHTPHRRIPGAHRRGGYSPMKLKRGPTYNNDYHFLFEPRGSKISVYHEHFDSAHVNEVIGLNALEAEKPRAMASLET